jgi:hypothetical protein
MGYGMPCDIEVASHIHIYLTNLFEKLTEKLFEPNQKGTASVLTAAQLHNPAPLFTLWQPVCLAGGDLTNKSLYSLIVSSREAIYHTVLVSIIPLHEAAA